MAEQRDVEAGDLLKVPTETKQQKKARLAAVLDRGFVNYRLRTDNLPPETVGQWVRNEPNEIANYEALGFEVWKEGDQKADSKDGTRRVGDVILMVTSAEHKQLLDEIQQDKFNRAHGLRGEQVEEKSFREGQFDRDITPVIESRVSEVSGVEINAAINNALKE